MPDLWSDLVLHAFSFERKAGRRSCVYAQMREILGPLQSLGNGAHGFQFRGLAREVATAPKGEEVIFPEDFLAGAYQSGGICYLCEKPIKPDQLIRYHGGPYLMHSACVTKIIEDHHSPDNL